MPTTAAIVRYADAMINKYATRDPFRLAEALGVEVYLCDFQRQRGAYRTILRNRFIFLNQNLDETMKKIVLLHELGHDTLHRKEAMKVGGFQEFHLFNMKNNRLEYEANVFAAQVALADDRFLQLCEQGFDAQQIAAAMDSDINLVALKADVLIAQGYRLRPQTHRSDFLRYDLT